MQKLMSLTKQNHVTRLFLRLIISNACFHKDHLTNDVTPRLKVKKES